MPSETLPGTKPYSLIQPEGLTASCHAPHLSRLRAPSHTQQRSAHLRLPVARSSNCSCKLAHAVPFLAPNLFFPRRYAFQLQMQASPHSAGFRLQRRRNSCPYSWIHLLATGT